MHTLVEGIKTLQSVISLNKQRGARNWLNMLKGNLFQIMSMYFIRCRSCCAMKIVNKNKFLVFCLIVELNHNFVVYRDDQINEL